MAAHCYQHGRWIIEQIASALHAAHEIGLVHRDVKPSNILVAKDDFTYLIDFGIARATGETALTNTGVTIGTWAYMAPERFQHPGKSGPAPRIHALAQRALSNPSPVDCPTPGAHSEQIAMAHMTATPPKPSAQRHGIPAAFDRVVDTGLAKDHDKRYHTAKDLAQAARAALTAPTRQTISRTSQRTTEAAKAPPERAAAAKPSSHYRQPADRLPAPDAPPDGDNFWFDVGIDPIRIITSVGDFPTLRCYLDDAPIFLGKNGMIDVFRSGRALRRYLASNPSNDMSSLSTYDEITSAARSRGSLPVKEVTEDNV